MPVPRGQAIAGIVTACAAKDSVGQGKRKGKQSKVSDDFEGQ
jgi:hypothetical protein